MPEDDATVGVRKFLNLTAEIRANTRKAKAYEEIRAAMFVNAPFWEIRDIIEKCDRDMLDNSGTKLT